MKSLSRKNGHIALFVANIIFGLNTPITRTIVPDIVDPFVLTLFRMVGAALLFLDCFIIRKKRKCACQGYCKILLCGSICNCAESNILYLWAIKNFTDRCISCSYIGSYNNDGAICNIYKRANYF